LDVRARFAGLVGDRLADRAAPGHLVEDWLDFGVVSLLARLDVALFVLLESNSCGGRHVPPVALITSVACYVAACHVGDARPLLHPRAGIGERATPFGVVLGRNLVLDAAGLLIALRARASASGPHLGTGLAATGECMRP